MAEQEQLFKDAQHKLAELKRQHQDRSLHKTKVQSLLSAAEQTKSNLESKQQGLESAKYDAEGQYKVTEDRIANNELQLGDIQMKIEKLSKKMMEETANKGQKQQEV